MESAAQGRSDVGRMLSTNLDIVFRVRVVRAKCALGVGDVNVKNQKIFKSISNKKMKNEKFSQKRNQNQSNTQKKI